MNFLNIFIAVDQIPVHLPQIEWRDSLMKRFFEGISREGMEIISENMKDLCNGCKGVTCENTEVRNIRFIEFPYGNFNISALPPSVTSIAIRACEQTFQIHTRSLPRNLRHICLLDNKVTGRLDLKTLPDKLKNAYFWGNRLTGPINLTKLPRTLQILRVQRNEIRQETVFYDNLPDDVMEISLSGLSDSNRIGSVRAVIPENAVKEKGIFMGIQEENVH